MDRVSDVQLDYRRLNNVNFVVAKFWMEIIEREEEKLLSNIVVVICTIIIQYILFCFKIRNYLYVARI